VSATPSRADGRRRAVISYLATLVVLLLVLVPLVILDWDIPFVGAGAMILAAGAVIYSVERWEDPARARERWVGSLPITAALLVGGSVVIGLYVVLLG